MENSAEELFLNSISLSDQADGAYEVGNEAEGESLDQTADDKRNEAMRVAGFSDKDFQELELWAVLAKASPKEVTEKALETYRAR